jgi:hypothetical protein
VDVTESGSSAIAGFGTDGVQPQGLLHQSYLHTPKDPFKTAPKQGTLYAFSHLFTNVESISYRPQYVHQPS